jgi:hypothetical protein
VFLPSEAGPWVAGYNIGAGGAVLISGLDRSPRRFILVSPNPRRLLMEKHPHIKAIEELFAAYAAKDVGLVRKVLAPDITWFIPGHHPLAGTKRGVDEVLAFFDQLAKADFKAEPKAIALSGDYVIDHHRGWSEKGPGLDILWCLVFRFEGGKIKEVTNLSSDQHKADLFFWSVYDLKPIPERLA